MALVFEYILRREVYARLVGARNDLDTQDRIALIDGVEESEGLAATSMNLSDAYGNGLLVLADDDNEGDHTNYKMVAWKDLAASLGLKDGPAHDSTDDITSGAITVSASVETTPVETYGDAADDPVVWVHPESPELSVIIGAQKKRGLNVYDLSGNLLQSLVDGRMNNVDLRYGFRLGDKAVRHSASNSVFIHLGNSKGVLCLFKVIHDGFRVWLLSILMCLLQGQHRCKLTVHGFQYGFCNHILNT